MTDFYVGSAHMPQVPLPMDECSEECINGSLYNFEKGYTPPPFSLTGFDEGTGIRINFEESPFPEECTCAIECIGTPNIIVGSDTGVFCPATTNYVYDLTIDTSTISNGDVASFSFTFVDANSNTSSIDVNSLMYTKPHPISKVVLKENNYYYVELGIPFSSVSGKSLTPYIDHYKIEMYQENTGNVSTMFGWSRYGSSSSPTHILDRKHGVITRTINSGVKYGFRVAYRTIYDEVSLYSDWTTAEASDYDVYSS